MATRKSNTSPQTAALKQILKRCSNFSKKNGFDHHHHHHHHHHHQDLPYDVPKGHFAVYVGENRSRQIVPLSWLDHPEFQNLLQRAEEEYGFKHDLQGLAIPCEEAFFRSLAALIR